MPTVLDAAAVKKEEKKGGGNPTPADLTKRGGKKKITERKKWKKSKARIAVPGMCFAHARFGGKKIP